MTNDKRNIVLLLLSIAFQISAFSQTYFQQEVNYNIRVTLNDSSHSIEGNIEIEYTNKSPDILDYIYFHLWPNAYKNNNTAFAIQYIENGDDEFYFAEEKDRGYIDSLYFLINDEVVKWEIDAKHIDICKVHLKYPLKPNETITIKTPFYVKLPAAKFSRLGHAGQTYGITQWYPKPAVYDKYGWHAMPYLDQGEFYSEFGSFDVYITVPENYVVAATGNIQDQKEIDWLNQKSAETKKVIQENSYSDKIPESSQNLKTLHFHENNIHDFAWWASKQYYVLKGSIKLPITGDEVNTWIYFTKNEARLWKNALEYINDALYYYSLWIGEYPYKNCSAVYSELGAGGGMEYPTITTIGATGNAKFLEQVIMHEVGHNWFYGILGSNERNFPYLDEGLNSAYEQRYIEAKYPDFKLYSFLFNYKTAKLFGIDKLNYADINYLGYLTNARQNIDQPIAFSSEDYSSINYVITLYQKSAFSFNYLKTYLGDDIFDKIMQEYFETWKFKHPYPEDLRNVFEKNTDKDLSWFFDDLITTTKKIDYKIAKLKSDSILIKNKGEINCPFNISGINENNEEFELWHNGFQNKKWIKLPTTNIDKLSIDFNNIIPELYRNNNQLKTSGVFKKVEPIKLQFAGLIQDPNFTQLNFSPVFGYNYNDKFMPGLLLFNNIWPQQNFEFQLIPLYSFGANNIVGNGIVHYHFFPIKKYLESTTLSLSGMRFGSNSLTNSFFYKLKLDAVIRIKQKHLRSSCKNHLTLNATSIPADLIYNFKYNLEFNEKIFSYHVNANFQGNNNFIKSWIEAKSTYLYKKDKRIELRVFYGKFLYQKTNSYGNYNFRLSGYTGSNDYLYDNYFIGREENIQINSDSDFLSHQFVENDGGFSIYSITQSNEWMASLNASFELPMLPVHFYYNLATFDEIESYPKSGTSYFYEAGLKVSFLNNLVNVYFPIKYSLTFDELAKINNLYNKYIYKVRFSLRFEKLNPFKLAKDFVYY